MDINQHACESLRLNHPETQVCVISFCILYQFYPQLFLLVILITQVRHEAAEDFLNLIKEWEKLCNSILSSEVNSFARSHNLNGLNDRDIDGSDASEDESEVYEVKEILDICYGDPNSKRKPALHFKVFQLLFFFFFFSPGVLEENTKYTEYMHCWLLLKF